MKTKFRRGAPRLRCENCPARNSKVKEYIIKRTGSRMTLCLECHRILVKLEEEADGKAKEVPA